MCDILFFLINVFDATISSSGSRVYPTTEMRDAMVFHCFVHMMRQHGVESCFAPGVHHVRTSSNHLQSQYFDKYFSRGSHFASILEQQRTRLSAHLQEICIDVGDVVSPWFRTLLSDFVLFQPSTVLKVWDEFFVVCERHGASNGWNVLYRCLLVVFDALEEQMMSLSLEGTMRLLWNIRSEREDVYNMDATELLLAGDQIVLRHNDIARGAGVDLRQVLERQRRLSGEAKGNVEWCPPDVAPPPTGVTALRGLLE